MVSNFDRIYEEIQREARRVSEELGLEPETLASLTLEIVNLEDRHRISHIHAINKKVRALIESAAVAQVREGSDRD
ncbi:MAG: hypothetical protein OXI33_03705 [Chloroflexota bacterium]|nr:hypothetical protein [Chloroflexota bacterium]